jgi:hypothetical protein
MNRPRTFEQRLEAWLEEGPASAPPDLLGEVLDSVPLHNPTRRRFGAARRLFVLSATAKFGAAIAAVLVIGVVGFSLILSKTPSIGGTGATPTPIVTDLPTASTGVVAHVPCGPSNLAARIVSWEGAAGHRIATVELKNTGSDVCDTKFVDRPQLVGGDGTVLIDGVTPPLSMDVLSIAPGDTVSTLVQDGNYCNDIPVAPITVAFVLSSGEGRIVATPVSPTDIDGLPPCNGDAGSAGSIEMLAGAP